MSERFAGPIKSCSEVCVVVALCSCAGVACSRLRVARSFFSAAVKAFVKRTREVIAQITLAPIDEIKSAMPCPTRWGGHSDNGQNKRCEEENASESKDPKSEEPKNKANPTSFNSR